MQSSGRRIFQLLESQACEGLGPNLRGGFGVLFSVAFVCFGCGAVTDWTSSRFGIVQRRLGCEGFGEPGQFGAYVNLKVT